MKWRGWAPADVTPRIVSETCNTGVANRLWSHLTQVLFSEKWKGRTKCHYVKVVLNFPQCSDQRSHHLSINDSLQSAAWNANSVCKDGRNKLVGPDQSCLCLKYINLLMKMNRILQRLLGSKCHFNADHMQSDFSANCCFENRKIMIWERDRI